MKMYPFTRFAPSPTGYLHRGHALSALWVWAIAEKYGYQVHLRIEDHDKSRARPEYIAAIREDLHWLGFQWIHESIQSERNSLYVAALENLKSKGLVYACDCSRKYLFESNAINEAGEVIYLGNCRHKNLPFSMESAIRFKTPNTTIAWNDLRLGSFSEVPFK